MLRRRRKQTDQGLTSPQVANGVPRRDGEADRHFNAPERQEDSTRLSRSERPTPERERDAQTRDWFASSARQRARARSYPPYFGGVALLYCGGLLAFFSRYIAREVNVPRQALIIAGITTAVVGAILILQPHLLFACWYWASKSGPGDVGAIVPRPAQRGHGRSRQALSDAGHHARLPGSPDASLEVPG